MRRFAFTSAVFALLATGCWLFPGKHGLRIASTSPRKGIACVAPPNGEREARLALDAVRRAWAERGYGYARDPRYDDQGPTVCYVPGNALGRAGMHSGTWVYVALSSRDGAPLALRDTALAHELLHDLLMRSCFFGKSRAPICGEDPAHADARFWGPGSVEERAQAIWRAAP